MNDSEHTFVFLPAAGTVEEVLEYYRSHFTWHGNDLDLLGQSQRLIEAGHYREALKFACEVQPVVPVTEEPPEEVDRATAQAAFLAAMERARPLYEQAAVEIEGKADGSRTMEAYHIGLDMLRNDPNW